MTATPSNWNDQELDNLRDLLDAEARCYEQTVDRMRLKKECLITGDMDTLKGVDHDLSALHQKARQLETDRAKLMTNLGYANRPLSELIPLLPGEHAGVLGQLRKRLLTCAREIDELNRNHYDLLTLSLKWLEESVAVIAEILNPEPASYTPQGGKTRKKPAAQAPPQSTVSHQA